MDRYPKVGRVQGALRKVHKGIVVLPFCGKWKKDKKTKGGGEFEIVYNRN